MLERGNEGFDGGYGSHSNSESRGLDYKGRLVKEKDPSEISLGRRFAAGAAALITSAGIAAGSMFPKRANAEESNTPPIGTSDEGIMPSQNLSASGGSSPEVTPSAPETDVDTISGTTYVPLTEEEKENLREIIADISPTATPVPTVEIIRAVEVFDIQKFEVYSKRLREYGCIDQEMIKVCAGWLYYLNNGGILVRNSKVDEDAYGDPKTYVTDEQILEFSVTGKGLEGLVAYDHEGFPRILKLNMKDKKLNAQFEKAIKFLDDVSGDDTIKTIWLNGTNAFFPCKWSEAQPDSSACAADRSGGIYPNVDKTGSKNPRLWYIFAEDIIGEIFYFNHRTMAMSVDYPLTLGYVEIIKTWLAAYNLAYLYNKMEKKDEDLKDLCESQKSTAEYWSKPELYNLPLDDPYLLRQMEIIMESNLVKPLGVDNWDFVKEGLGEIK